MHLITGFLLAALAGAKKNKNGHPKVRVPRFTTGPVQTAHALPGRLRLRVPSLKENGPGRDLIRGRLPAIDGVEAVDVSPLSGSVLIRYREQDVEPELLFAAVVHLLDLEKEMDAPCKPLVVRELKSMGDSLNRAVYEKTGGVIDLWTAVMIVLAGAGVRIMLKNPARAFPAGFTLIWWGLNAFRRTKVDLE
jgi:hypothetical protein